MNVKKVEDSYFLLLLLHLPLIELFVLVVLKLLLLRYLALKRDDLKLPWVLFLVLGHTIAFVALDLEIVNNVALYVHFVLVVFVLVVHLYQHLEHLEGQHRLAAQLVEEEHLLLEEVEEELV